MPPPRAGGAGLGALAGDGDLDGESEHKPRLHRTSSRSCTDIRRGRARGIGRDRSLLGGGSRGSGRRRGSNKSRRDFWRERKCSWWSRRRRRLP